MAVKRPPGETGGGLILNPNFLTDSNLNANQKTTAEQIRGFFRELFRSNYCRFLEQELVRQRMDYDSRIRQLIAEKLEFAQKIHELQVALIPQLRKPMGSAFRPPVSTAELMGPTSWSQALEEHAKELEKETVDSK